MKYDWAAEIRGFLRAELARKNIGWPELVDLLRQVGVEETVSSVKSKVARGNFSGKFLGQCLCAIDATDFHFRVSFADQFASGAERRARAMQAREPSHGAAGFRGRRLGVEGQATRASRTARTEGRGLERKRSRCLGGR